jgi:hypothetical protein
MPAKYSTSLFGDQTNFLVEFPLFEFRFLAATNDTEFNEQIRVS